MRPAPTQAPPSAPPAHPAAVDLQKQQSTDSTSVKPRRRVAPADPFAGIDPNAASVDTLEAARRAEPATAVAAAIVDPPEKPFEGIDPNAPSVDTLESAQRARAPKAAAHLTRRAPEQPFDGIDPHAPSIDTLEAAQRARAARAAAPATQRATEQPFEGIDLDAPSIDTLEAARRARAAKAAAHLTPRAPEQPFEGIDPNAPSIDTLETALRARTPRAAAPRTNPPPEQPFEEIDPYAPSNDTLEAAQRARAAQAAGPANGHAAEQPFEGIDPEAPSVDTLDAAGRARAESSLDVAMESAPERRNAATSNNQVVAPERLDAGLPPSSGDLGGWLDERSEAAARTGAAAPDAAASAPPAAGTANPAATLLEPPPALERPEVGAPARPAPRPEPARERTAPVEPAGTLREGPIADWMSESAEASHEPAAPAAADEGVTAPEDPFAEIAPRKTDRAKPAQEREADRVPRVDEKRSDAGSAPSAAHGIAFPLSVRRLNFAGTDEQRQPTGGRPRMPLVRPWRDDLSINLPPPSFPASYAGISQARLGAPPDSDHGYADDPPQFEDAPAEAGSPRTRLKLPSLPRLGLLRHWREAHAASGKQAGTEGVKAKSYLEKVAELEAMTDKDDVAQRR
jgi:hypothetical protein